MKTPDDILAEIINSEKKNNKGKLKIFFGMCAGVGKTYSMLKHAKELLHNGADIVIGYVETHGREETAELTEGFLIIPRIKLIYKGIEFEEFDLEKTLELRPEYVIVDELAHTNMAGTKHSKRYQDVLELLDNGINVFTTLNVQHIESRSKTVEQITGVSINETVPDSIIELAEDIELIDLPIEELLKRLYEGKVYFPDKIKLATNNFFKTGNLISLREMALRLTAEKVESDLIDYMSEKNIKGPWKAGDTILVAVGSSPYSAELIRWARRIAYSLKTKWFAVYVRTNDIIDEIKNQQLEINLRLAKELGAEVITTANTDLVAGIIDIAVQHNVTQIIIGKPAKYSILNYIKKNNYIDRLINESGDIDVYIVRPSKVKQKDIKKSKRLTLKSKPKEYLIAALSVFIFSIISLPFTNYIGYQTIGLILLLNLIILPFFIGRGPIIFAALLNSLLWNYLFIPPLFTFEIDKLHDLMTLILNMVVAISSGFLSTKIRKQQQLVKLREVYTLAMLNFTQDLSKSNNKFEIIQTTLEHIDKTINANATFINLNIEPIASTRELWTITEKEKSIAKWSLENNQISGKFTNNLPDSICQYIPIISSNSKIGILALYLINKQSVESENLVNNFLTQMINIYEKQDSREILQKIELEKESKKLYDTLIDSISHEFRTPIAVITGASSILFDNKVNENHIIVNELAKEIYSASKRIDLLVENLLDINRLESGQLNLNKTVNSINELIYDVITQINIEAKDRKISTEFDKTNPYLLIDYNFIRQAIFNIVNNACVYTPDNALIEIKTELYKDKCVIIINDYGQGVSPEHLDKLFDKFYRVQNSKTGGTGLGLSISKGFIEAHKGKISANINSSGGLMFYIELPI